VSTLEILRTVASVEDVLDEYDLNGDSWMEDEEAEAFRDLLPDIRILVEYVKELS